jgi:hypothetical protein
MTNSQAIASALPAFPLLAQTTQLSRGRVWTGRVLTGLSTAFFLFDAVMKLFKPPFVVETTIHLGYPESTIIGIGLALLVSTLLYLKPRTSIFGAILLTGYLGGAVATNIRAQTPLFNIVFPIVFAAIAWAGLCLRDARLAQVLFSKR